MVFLLREHLCLSQFKWCSCCASIICLSQFKWCSCCANIICLSQFKWCSCCASIISLSQFKWCSCCVSISVSVSSSGVLAARASLSQSQSVHAVFLLRKHHLSQSVQVVFLLREHLCLSQFKRCSCCTSISVSVSSRSVLAARASSVSVNSRGVLAA